jgi:lipoyl(octanoyl) transferase
VAVTAAFDGTLPVAEHPVVRPTAPAGLDLRLHPSLA